MARKGTGSPKQDRTGDYLTPEEPWGEDERKYLDDNQLRAFDKPVRCRVFTRPSFEGREAMGIAEREQTWFAFAASAPDKNLFSRTEYSEMEIPRPLGEKILAVWLLMLLKPVSGHPSLGLDGTTYHFSMEVGGEALAGQVWSPDGGTMTGVLVEIAETMRDCCRAKDQAGLVLLQERADTLFNRLAARHRGYVRRMAAFSREFLAEEDD